MILELENLGYIFEKIPEDLFLSIKKEISDLQNNLDTIQDVGFQLAGHLDKEIRFPPGETKTQLENYLLELGQKYHNRYNYLKCLKKNLYDSNLTMADSCWINFQKATDFNPVHDHSGVFSFVIWVQVPYMIEEQREHFIGKKSVENLTGCFQFVYNDILGNISTKPIPVDRRYEGKIIFFPASLKHTVYPFYDVDDYRISIAGNLLLDNVKSD